MVGRTSGEQYSSMTVRYVNLSVAGGRVSFNARMAFSVSAMASVLPWLTVRRDCRPNAVSSTRCRDLRGDVGLQAA